MQEVNDVGHMILKSQKREMGNTSVIQQERAGFFGVQQRFGNKRFVSSSNTPRIGNFNGGVYWRGGAAQDKGAAVFRWEIVGIVLAQEDRRYIRLVCLVLLERGEEQTQGVCL